MPTVATSVVDRVVNFFRGSASVTQQPHIVRTKRSHGAALPPERGHVPLDSPVITARYEAGWMGSYDRSWLPAYVQDARQDLSPAERLEMVRKARYFEQNNPTMQKILDLIEVNVVGTGIAATAASSDPVWNNRADEYWSEWCKYADLTSRQSFESLQALMARAQAVDGEIFVWLTYGESKRPRIQLIETHRVCDAKLPRQYDQEGYVQFDGILSDPNGRPAFYVVTNDADAFSKVRPSSVALIPADEMVHIFEPSRASQPRSPTLFHACLPDLHDLDDLQRYEMMASKDAASRANVVTTSTGELPDDGTVIGKEEQIPDSNGEIQERITYYQTAFGGRTVVLKNGDTWNQGTALRPTPAQQEFWKILERKVCRGSGVSYAALTDYEGNWGGPALRGAITSDNRFYDIRTQTLASGLQQIREFVLKTEMRAGGALSGAPKDWRKTMWHSPRRATVDIGRDSKALIEELRAGIRTYEQVMGELGLDWRSTLRQRAIEEKFINDLAAELGVDRVRIASLILNERAQLDEANPEDAPSTFDPATQQPAAKPDKAPAKKP